MAQSDTVPAQAAAPTAPKAPAPGAIFPADPGADRPVMAVVAILVALACVAGFSARAAWAAADSWTKDLAGAMTIQVRGAAGLTGSDAAAEAALVAKDLPGVLSAQALSREDAEALVAPWFGDNGLGDDIPLPGLVDIRLDPYGPVTAQDLAGAMQAAGLIATVDDHRAWSAPLRRTATAVRGAGLLAVSLLVAATALVTAFAVRASMAARSNVVAVLHLCGAEDAYIAAEVTRRFFTLGAQAGLIGGATALVAGGAVTALTRTEGAPSAIAPHFALAPPDVILVLLAPALTAGLAAAAARAAAMHALRRMA